MTIELSSPSANTYTVAGKSVPRVTTVLNTLYDFSGVPQDQLAFAADRGRMVHLATQYIDEGDFNFDYLDAQLKPYIDAYQQFLEDVRPQWSGIERLVHSEKYGYAGQLDRVGVLCGLKGEPEAIVDIKAVVKLSPITALQTAAYEMADRVEHRESARARYALQLKKDGTYKLQKYDDPTDFSVFLSALSLHNWRTRNGL